MAESKVYIASLSSKGQVTIPAAVRKHLGITAQDKVVFRVFADNRVEIEPMQMTLQEAYGSVPPMNRPEDFATLERIAKEERGERWRS